MREHLSLSRADSTAGISDAVAALFSSERSLVPRGEG